MEIIRIFVPLVQAIVTTKVLSVDFDKFVFIEIVLFVFLKYLIVDICKEYCVFLRYDSYLTLFTY